MYFLDINLLHNFSSLLINGWCYMLLVLISLALCLILDVFDKFQYSIWLFFMIIIGFEMEERKLSKFWGKMIKKNEGILSKHS